MLGLPRPARLLWLIVVACGVSSLGWSALVARDDVYLLPIVGLFVVAAATAESFTVLLPGARPGHGFDESVGSAVTIAAMLVLPAHWAVLVAAAGIAFARQGAWFKRLFNVAQLSLSTAAGALVWQLAGPSRSPADPGAIPWVLAAFAVHFLLDKVWITTMIALVSGLPVWMVWWRSYRHIWPATLSIALVGVLMAVLWSTSRWAIALAGIPLSALYYTLRNTVSLETQTREALFSLADILDARDPYTHGHSQRVGQYAERLAVAMGLSGDEAHLVYLSGRLHDIGKCAVRNEVLLKPAALDEEERTHMCIHPEVGSSMLSAFSLFKECAAFVRGHHERWDGRGYPDGLKGENIPLGARVIAVADAFDAMTTTRPYRTALPQAEAFRRLRAGAGAQWDARVVAVFLDLLDAETGDPSELVRLVA